MPLPYKSHPIYGLRLALIISAAISLLITLNVVLSRLTGPGYSDYWETIGLWIVHGVCAILSIALSRYDLRSWATLKAANPDEDPEWPLRRTIIGDVVLGLGFWALWAAEVDQVQYSWRYPYYLTAAYANFTAIIVAVLHAISLWKELQALKDRWLALHLCRCANNQQEENTPVAVRVCWQRGRPRRWEHANATRCQCGDDSGRNGQDVDIEAAAVSQGESAHLITPTTDDTAGQSSSERTVLGDHPRGYGAVGYHDTVDQDLGEGTRCDEEDDEEEVMVVKKKKKRAGKEIASESRGRERGLDDD